MPTDIRFAHVFKLAPVLLLIGVGCSSASSEDPTASSSSDAVTGGTIASIALANVGRGACSTNSQGGYAFDSSCTGNGGQPEYWCADFARWVWGAAGADTGGLSAAAGSFYTYGQAHGTLSNTPQVGDAVVFNYHGGGSADHVAIVSAVFGSSIETVSGDWAGENGSEAFFSSTSHVILNQPGYYGGVGSYAGEMGMTISGFIAPAGGLSAAVGANGCTAQEDANAAHFGCACVDHQASGGFCAGTGCTAQATADAAHFGCFCVDGQASGGYCDGSGCTPLETEDAAKFGCSCVDHQGNGGACKGTGCTAKETNDCAHFGAKCNAHKCVK